MNLGLSEDQQFFLDTTRKFLNAEMPLTGVRALAELPDGFDRTWWRRGAELGWTSMLVSEADGGGSVSGEGPLDLVIVAEELGRTVAPGPFLPVNLVAFALGTDGSAAQKSGALAGLLNGDNIAAWCFQEPGGNWRPESIAVAAEQTADGFLLSGTKVKVEAAGQADQLLVAAITGDGLTQFLVPTERAGVSITPLHSLDLVRRFGEVTFDAVQLDAGDVVGSVGGAADTIERMLQLAVLIQCAEMTGAAAEVFRFTTQYAFDRYSFGRPLASYQALKHRFADMKLWLEASHATTDGAARAVADDHDAARLTSIAKTYVSDHLPELIQDCVQIHGGIGVTWEHDIHLYLRRVTVDRGLFGGPDTHRELITELLVS